MREEVDHRFSTLLGQVTTVFSACIFQNMVKDLAFSAENAHSPRHSNFLDLKLINGRGSMNDSLRTLY